MKVSCLCILALHSAVRALRHRRDAGRLDEGGNDAAADLVGQG